jgi:hypothetical protein
MNKLLFLYIFIIFGCTNKHKLEFSDYIVPVHDMDFSILQEAGRLSVKSISLSLWLEKNGTFGKSVALNDTRLFENASNDGKRFGIESKQLLNTIEELNEHLEYENQVNDICYQLMCEEYKVEHISYRENRMSRNIKIKKLLLIIKNSPNKNASRDASHP